MTKRNNNTVIVGSIVLGLVLLGVIVNHLQPKNYDWKETYKKEVKEQPYASGILYEMLDGYFPEKDFHIVQRSLVSEIPLDKSEAANYVFIGPKLYLKTEDVAHLMAFAEAGNSIFVSSKDYPDSFVSSLFYADCDELVDTADANIFTDVEWDQILKDSFGIDSPIEERYPEEYDETMEYEEEYTEEYGDTMEYEGEYTKEYEEEYSVEDYVKERRNEAALTWEETIPWQGVEVLYDSLAEFNYSHPQFKAENPYTYKHVVKDKASNRGWHYFSKSSLCEEGVDYASLGRMNGKELNFIRIPKGKGFVYLHSDPYLFSNFHLKEDYGFEYAGKVFSHLPEGDFYWDEKSSKYSKMEGMKKEATSSLRYILSQRSLRWAWYLLLVTAVLYLLFRAKRQQRIIPVIQGNTNSSLEFINTIGRLYYLQNDHRQLARRKMQMFLAYVRDHYSIPTHQINQSMKERLAKKSEVPMAIIEDIFLRFSRIDRAGEVSESHLINFHQVMEAFFERSK